MIPFAFIFFLLKLFIHLSHYLILLCWFIFKLYLNLLLIAYSVMQNAFIEFIPLTIASLAKKNETLWFILFWFPLLQWDHRTVVGHKGESEVLGHRRRDSLQGPGSHYDRWIEETARFLWWFGPHGSQGRECEWISGEMRAGSMYFANVLLKATLPSKIVCFLRRFDS